MERINQTINLKWLRRSVVIAFLDIIIIMGSYFGALYLRFEFVFDNIPEKYIYGYVWSMPYWIVATIVVFYGCRLYHSIWRFASIAELERMVGAFVMLIPAYVAGSLFMELDMPRSYYLMGYVLSFGFCTGIRFGYRFLRYWQKMRKSNGAGSDMERVMVIGAGSAGQVIIKELNRSGAVSSRVCCVIDDNPAKKNRIIEGVPIVGGRNDILWAAEEYRINKIIFAIPSMKASEKKEILNLCKETNCKMQTVPGIYQLVNGEVKVDTLRDVDITDLLGRDEITINNEEVYKLISGLTILVTGGGGSIGSELCRQIADNHPKQLIIVDIYENSAYEIQQELKRKYPNLNLQVLIGSVREEKRMTYIMETYRPDVVFHAAAHKHVPLMEDSPNEAVKNNVLGTYKTAKAAAAAGVDTFVLISTDKAVNPTSIMGATKRICEMIIQMMNRKSETRFVAVRFGNVLGSNGSVIPLFKQQIANGGPVTVTHPDIIRYFMTIPEAVSLVLQAAYYAKGGEIFVLDMGEPVKIADMARNLIRLSGLTPDVDIRIEYTGLRPGEKLYEEMLMAEEGMEKTANKLIYIGRPLPLNDEWLENFIEELSEIDDLDPQICRKMVNRGGK